MGRILLFLLIAVAGVSLLVAPWITALAYVANSLVQPQYIWFWIFEGVPIHRITAGMAILALLISMAQKTIDFNIYKNKQNAMLLVLWGWMHISHAMSSYKGAFVSVPPGLVLDTLNSILIMYFVILPLCQKEVALRYLCGVFVFAGIYYIYWANSAYFSQEWYRFVNNRLVGPSNSPYADANVLSTLIVMCVPFIIFMYFRTKNKAIRIMIALMVPLAWHAMILFSSRAALLASIISMIAIAYTIRSAKVNIALGVAFFLFLTYQGAMLLDRTTDTIQQAQVEQDEPINPRLLSWETGLKLIPLYPIFGAGVQMFEAAAVNHFPGKTRHVAHNTFLNFSVNAGLLSGVIFLSLIWLAWARLKESRKMQETFENSDYYALVSSSVSLIGYFVCSMFLDLIIFEPFYIVLLINLIAYYRVTHKDHDNRSQN